MQLKGKCAPITGGNSGIGLATARRFVAEGARVAIRGHDAPTLAAAANELGLTAIRSDVLEAQARSSLFDRIKDEFGHLDILFANAGIAKFSPIEETLEKDFDDVLRTNVTTAFLTVHAALRLMGPGASIVLNGSMAATTGSSESSAYAASKAGVGAMCRSLAGELSPRGIRVNAVVPGVIETPIWERNGRTARSRCGTRASPPSHDSTQSRW
jgi:NAD(P)-dependent dehydrogenase (short-subunit alcohol dehydrogenase family)